MSPAHVEAGINIKNAAGNNPSAYKPMFRRSSQIENGYGSVLCNASRIFSGVIGSAMKSTPMAS